MYAADTRIDRVRFGEDSWTRIIDLYIPVSNPTIWDRQKSRLQNIFRFLTGDIWTLNFRRRANDQFRLCPLGNLNRYKMPYDTNTVCLFSGGMDSFIGAVDLLENGVRPLLVGHSKSGDVSPFQAICTDALLRAYPQNVPSRIYAFIKIPKKAMFDSEEHSERGRSFLFLTLGAITASALSGQSELVVPENGMISLNIPLTPLRIGSLSTRTTHPFYLNLMQTLFDELALDVKIKNPYQFKTKGEMLRDCKNAKLVTATNTMSCSHPSGRWEGQGNIHCGYCVPCIIRQAAYKAAGMADTSGYRKNIFDNQGLQIDKAEGANVLAFQYLIGKINKQPMHLTAMIRTTGPLGEDVSPYIDVYKRSLQEVQSFLATAILK